jgi:hypothetical protein
MTDWMRLEPPSSQGIAAIAPQQISKRGKQDMVYRCRQLYR